MKNKKIKYFIPSILMAIFIAYGSLTSGENEEVKKLFNLGISDKIIHGFFYFTLTLSILYPILQGKYRAHVNLTYIFILIFLYGIIMELLQYWLIENRSGEIYDVVANTTGILVAYILARIYKNKIQIA